jgi:hypothetical protein
MPSSNKFFSKKQARSLKGQSLKNIPSQIIQNIGLLCPFGQVLNYWEFFNASLENCP